LRPIRSLQPLLAAALALLCGAQAVAASTEPLSINWYHDQPFLQPVIDAFTAETGIPVKVTSDYDTFDTDVIFVSDYKGLLEAKQFGHFRKLDPAFAAEMAKVVPAQWRDDEGTWLGVVLRIRTAVVNDELVAKEDRPKQLLDLADPKWQGKMTIRSAANVYNRSMVAYMIHRYGEAEAARWAQGIARNFGTGHPYLGDTGNARAVANGDFAISFLNTYYLGYLQARRTDPPEVLKKLRDDLDVIWLDGGPHGLPANVTGVGISSHIEDEKRVAEAQKLVAFLLSKKGQALMSEHVFKYPVRRDVAPSEYLRQFGTFKMDMVDLNELRYRYDDADRIMAKAGWRTDR
jgi:iron(III) transport system substrate-binding protein